MADYNSTYTGAQIDAGIALANTSIQPDDLGTAAATDATDYATAAQGDLADSAVQPGDDAADLGSGAATDGYVLTADGAGGVAWEAGGGGGGSTDYVRTRAGNVQDLFDMSDTWNDGATTFTSIKMGVTDTASNAASNLLDLQVGSSSRAAIDKNGVLTVNTPDIADSATLFEFKENGVSKFKGSARDGFNMSMGISRALTVQRDGNPVLQLGNAAGVGRVVTGNGTVEWNPNTVISGANDLILARDAANTLAQRNGTNAQTFNLYNTYTDASNYERGFMKWNSNVLEIGTEAAGTGVIRTIFLGSALAGLTLPLGDGTTAKANLNARDGVYLSSRGVNRVFLNENGLTDANFHPTGDGTVKLGVQTGNLGWTQIAFREVSADPANPDEGQSVLWQSDGTASGDDGDIMVKITAGGVTKTVTLVDFSAV